MMRMRARVALAVTFALILMVTPVVATGAEIALKFQWESTKDHGGYFHDVRRFNSSDETITGGSWAALPANDQLQEDRLAVMVEDPMRPIPGFKENGCYVACHDVLNTMPGNTGQDSRHFFEPRNPGNPTDLNGFGVDMWHWRGARSGPSGYADDTWVRVHERTADAAIAGRRSDVNTPRPAAWIQGLNGNQDFGGAIIWNGIALPRYVFNPTKSTTNQYFLGDDGGVFDSVANLWQLREPTYRSQLVAYQDYDFDPVDKVNAIDVQYLRYFAGNIDITSTAPFNGWTAGQRDQWVDFWAAQLPGLEYPQDAEGMLDAILAQMKNGVMVTRNVAYIYDSNQHDIDSEYSVQYAQGGKATWNLTMYRALSTGDVNDTDMAALLDGQTYNLGIGIHDVNGAGNTHHAVPPLVLGLSGHHDTQIAATKVKDPRSADWQAVPSITVTAFQPGTVSWQYLRSNEHTATWPMIDLYRRCYGAYCHGGEAEIHTLIKDSPFTPVSPYAADIVYLKIQAAITADPDATRLNVFSANSTLSKYGAAYYFRGSLVDSETGTPIAGKRVRLQSSAKTTGFKNTSRVATTDANGRYSFKVVPRNRTYYRATFTGDDIDFTSAVPSAYRRVTPRALVGTPVAPKTMYRNRAKTIYGSLKPRHTAGSSPVRLQIQRKSGSKWVKHSTVRAKASNYSSYSRYKRSVTFTRAGQYRMRATHPTDALHAAHTSKWRYVTVK